MLHQREVFQDGGQKSLQGIRDIEVDLEGQEFVRLRKKEKYI